jgi:hypothetical protein
MTNVPTVSAGDSITATWGQAVSGRLSTGCAVYATGTAQSVANDIGTLETVTFVAANVTSDPDSWFDDATNQITVPEAGTYLCWGYAKFTNNSAGERRFALRVNGSNHVETLYDATTVTQPLGGPVIAMVTLVANDDVTIAAAQNSGGALDIIVKGLAVWRLW